MEVGRVEQVNGLWRLAGETNGYLIVREGQGLLIDCPAKDAMAVLTAHGLPRPQAILHTQVQKEHCREGATDSTVKVYVSVDSIDVAEQNARFRAETRTVWPSNFEWDYRGEDKYGIGSCLAERPPARPLKIAGSLRAGDVFRWQDVDLEVLDLPGSGKRSLGFLWRRERVLFSGDVFYAGGFLVNLYDLERNYGGNVDGTLPGLSQLKRSLSVIESLDLKTVLPSTGPAITQPKEDILRLQERIHWLEDPPVRRAGTAAEMINYRPRREFGRYREVVPGLFQNNNFGNVILFVDGQGHGVMIDPDPCVWLPWEDSCRAMHEDLDLLERYAGLKRVELVLITHYHGDHLRFVDLIRARYGATFLATPDVADRTERPEDFNYPCMLPWYNLPFRSLKADLRIAYDRPVPWRGTTVTPIHTPGHCDAHAGYVVPWQNRLTVCTGDTLSYGSGPICCRLPVIYNDTAWPDRGFKVTFSRLRKLRPDLILGSHSHSFFDGDGSIIQDFCAAAEEAEELAARMVPDRRLQQAMTPPGFDEMRSTGMKSAPGRKVT